MQLATITQRNPHLVQALVTLAQRADYQEDGSILLEDLSGITVLVAKKFTNDRTADGLLEAYYLTVGCVSLGINVHVVLLVQSLFLLAFGNVLGSGIGRISGEFLVLLRVFIFIRVVHCWCF